MSSRRSVCRRQLHPNLQSSEVSCQFRRLAGSRFRSPRVRGQRTRNLRSQDFTQAVENLLREGNVVSLVGGIVVSRNSRRPRYARNLYDVARACCEQVGVCPAKRCNFVLLCNPSRRGTRNEPNRLPAIRKDRDLARELAYTAFQFLARPRIAGMALR